MQVKRLFTAPRTKGAEDKPPEAPLVVSHAEGGHLRPTLWAASRSAPGGICLRHGFKVRLSREAAKSAKKKQKNLDTNFHRLTLRLKA